MNAISRTYIPQPNDTSRLLFTIQETAQMLGMSQSTLIRCEQDGLIRAFRFKRTVRFSWDEIQRFIASGVAA
jgi:excisionase family DNA binding protein